MAAEGQSDKMVSDMEACTKQRCGIEFLHVDKIACFWPQRPNSISSVRWWVVHFSSDGSNMKDKPCSEQPCTAVTVTWRVSLPAHPRELDYNLGTVYRAEYLLQCVGTNGSSVGISQRSWWISHMLTKEQEEHFLQVCQDLLNHTSLKAAASWIASLPVMRCGFSATSWSQNSNMWSSDVWIPHGRCSRHSPQCVKWCALSFGTVKW